MDKGEFERALRDPAAAFAGPEDIARRPDLRPGGKRALLERWRDAHGGSRGGTAAGDGGNGDGGGDAARGRERRG